MMFYEWKQINLTKKSYKFINLFKNLKYNFFTKLNRCETIINIVGLNLIKLLGAYLGLRIFFQVSGVMCLNNPLKLRLGPE